MSSVAVTVEAAMVAEVRAEEPPEGEDALRDVSPGRLNARGQVPDLEDGQSRPGSKPAVTLECSDGREGSRATEIPEEEGFA